jgi:hypothetical protein
MENEFIPYNLAVKLKDLGFNLPCYMYIYTGDTGNNYDHYIGVKPIDSRDWNGKSDLCVSRPTFSQAFRWFRDKYNLDSCLKPEIISGKKSYDFYIWIDNNEDLEFGVTKISTYEEAELICLEKLIEIVEQKEK